MKKTPLTMNWQLSARGRVVRDLICLPHTGASSLQPPQRSLEEGLYLTGGHVRKDLIAGQYLMLLLKYSGKENGVFLQLPLLFQFLKLSLSGFPV